jgi:hypothetical protein
VQAPSIPTCLASWVLLCLYKAQYLNPSASGRTRAKTPFFSSSSYGSDGDAAVARRRGEARVHDPQKRRSHGREFDSPFELWASLFAGDCALLFNSRYDLVTSSNQIFGQLRKFGLQIPPVLAPIEPVGAQTRTSRAPRVSPCPERRAWALFSPFGVRRAGYRRGDSFFVLN